MRSPALTRPVPTQGKISNPLNTFGHHSRSVRPGCTVGPAGRTHRPERHSERGAAMTSKTRLAAAGSVAIGAVLAAAGVGLAATLGTSTQAGTSTQTGQAAP